MRIEQLHIKNFRCFSQLSLDLGYPIVVFEGANGSGKTSLLEALHYLCYLRSFRTHTPRELVQFEASSFFIKIQVGDEQGGNTDLQVGFSGKKRLVKVDQRAVQSFKELMNHYRVVTLTEDDLALIKEGPDVRRAFVDQALVLLDPGLSTLLRSLKLVLENRNALLARGTGRAQLEVWTQKLWEKSVELRRHRREVLSRLESRLNELLERHFGEKGGKVSLEYQAKQGDYDQSYDLFVQNSGQLFEEEVRFRRSLFGAHLDDFVIVFRQKRSRAYASRGQQKLVMVLLKIAQMQELVANSGSAVFLLDDFMTDFDETTAFSLLDILVSLRGQLIFTCPVQGGALDARLEALGAHKVRLPH